MEQESGDRQKWRVNTEYNGPPVPWRPGYALPRRWKSKLDREGLPYLVELEFAAGDDGPQCRAVRLEARDNGAPIAARDMRKVPIGECIQLAITSAAMREERLPGAVSYQFGGGQANVTDLVRLARPVDERTKDARLRGVADVYQANEKSGKPTLAVQDALNCPYSTAARLVVQARQRGFLPPAKRRGGGTPADVESLGISPRDIPTTAPPLAEFLGTEVQARARARRAEQAQRRAEAPDNPNEEN